VDTNRLDTALAAAFESTPTDRRVVVRQACDLADSGKAETDRGHELTIDEITTQLQDAPDEMELVERWNWWIGTLDIAYGGYTAFTVQATPEDPAPNR
jgi:hypothetical protein